MNSMPRSTLAASDGIENISATPPVANPSPPSGDGKGNRPHSKLSSTCAAMPPVMKLPTG